MTLDELLQKFRDEAAKQKQLIEQLNEIKRLDRYREKNLGNIKQKIRALEKRLDRIDDSTVTDIQFWLERYKQDLKATTAAQKKRFGIELEAELSKLSLTLKGQYPSLKAGIFTFEVDFDKSFCGIWYGPKQELLDKAPINAEAVRKKVETQQKNLGSKVEPEEITELMHIAYRHAALDMGTNSVPLPALLPYLALALQNRSFHSNPIKEKYRSYRRADFSYDLYRAKSVLLTKSSLKTATRQETRRKNNFLWFPTNASGNGNYFSNIEWREQQNAQP